MNKIILVSLLTFSIYSCKKNGNFLTKHSTNDSDCVTQLKDKNPKTCCSTDHLDQKTKLIDEINYSENSIFNLESNWNTQADKTIKLKQLQGKILVVVMFYTSCKSVCPRLVADMKNIEKAIPKNKLNQMNFVLISIDPDTDTPKILNNFAKRNSLPDSHWTLLQGTKNNVQELANVLSVKYKQISPMDFSHSTIISIFNSEGELSHQQEGLGVDNKETLSTIENLLK